MDVCLRESEEYPCGFRSCISWNIFILRHDATRHTRLNVVTTTWLVPIKRYENCTPRRVPSCNSRASTSIFVTVLAKRENVVAAGALIRAYREISRAERTLATERPGAYALLTLYFVRIPRVSLSSSVSLLRGIYIVPYLGRKTKLFRKLI